MSGMDMVDKVLVPSGGTVKSAPAGYHLMCEQPKMKIGAKAPVSFSLSNGTTQPWWWRFRCATRRASSRPLQPVALCLGRFFWGGAWLFFFTKNRYLPNVRVG